MARAKKNGFKQSPILLDKAQDRALDLAAKKLDRSRASVIRQLIQYHLPELLEQSAPQVNDFTDLMPTTEEGRRKIKILNDLKVAMEKGEVACPQCGLSDAVALVAKQSSPLRLVLDYKVDWMMFLFNLQCSRCSVRWSVYPDRPTDAQVVMEKRAPVTITYPPDMSHGVVHESESATTQPQNLFAQKKEKER